MLIELRRRWAAMDEARKALIAEGEALTAASADGEERSLTPEEDARFTEIVSEARGLGNEMVELRAQIEELEAAERAVGNAHRTADFNVNHGVTRNDPYVGEVRADAPMGELRGRATAILAAERSVSPEQADRVLEVVESQADGDVRLVRHLQASGRQTYRSAFGKLMVGRMETLTPEEVRSIQEVRAASLTDSAGGYVIPFTLDPTIIDTRSGVADPMRQLARIVKTTTDSWNGVSSAGVTASWDAEAVVVSDDAPTLAQPSIDVHKASAFVPYSIEIGQDWQGMESDIRLMFQNGKEDLEAPAFVSGNGTSAPEGFVTALDGSASEVASAGEALTAADLYALEEALGPRYRARAAFQANRAIYNLVRQIDASGGTDLWVRIGAGLPPELLGYGAYENSSMDGTFNPAATADNFVLALGDWQNYVIVDRMGMQVEAIPHLFDPTTGRPKGQRGLYAHWRTGGGVTNINGLRLLNIATAA